MKWAQIFSTLDMPNDLEEAVRGFYEDVPEDYVHWDPQIDEYVENLEKKLKKDVNEWMLKDGLVVNPNEKYPYILIRME